MKKLVLFSMFLLLLSCNQEDMFLDEATSRLKDAVERSLNSKAEIEGLDTIFTAKKHGTDSLFLVGFRLSVVSESNTTRYEYLYQNIDGRKRELLNNLKEARSQSLEEYANEKYRERGISYRDLIITYAMMKLAMFGKDI